MGAAGALGMQWLCSVYPFSAAHKSQMPLDLCYCLPDTCPSPRCVFADLDLFRAFVKICACKEMLIANVLCCVR